MLRNGLQPTHIVIFVLVILPLLVALVIWLVVRATAAGRRDRERIARLEEELYRLQTRLPSDGGGTSGGPGGTDAPDDSDSRAGPKEAPR
ncbi:hypothetical protein GCM10023169_24590 [Georgenia halophila]|uniref:Uncharacterized protein n=1 Tax=Georgenia halophila TaxID=620889 RepID=A0ABP8LD18_9MICO